MSSILLVSPTGPAPDFLSLLSHDLGTAASAEEALRRVDLVDAVVVDARGDLAWARTATTLIRQTRPDMPLLLMVAGSALGLLSPDWGFSDFVIDGCEAAEVDVRLRLLLHSGNQPHILMGTNMNSCTVPDNSTSTTLDKTKTSESTRLKVVRGTAR